MLRMNASDPMTETPKWFAMSAPFRRELRARQMLDERGVINFVPMRYKIVSTRNGRKSRELAPVVPSLIFVRTSDEEIKALKSELQIIQYLVRKENGRGIPIVVPDAQMEQFMAVASTWDEKLIYLKPEEVDLKKGTRVRVLGGALNGKEGVFMRVKGARSRRLVIMLEGVTAIAVEVAPDLIEVLDA